MPTIVDIRNYYKSSLEKKVFFDKKTSMEKTYYIMYLHDAKKEEEYFVETFSQYFPYYVWNEDQLDTLNISAGMKASLELASKNCWNSQVVAKRQTQANGIYGELFLDFYERVVHDRKLITTYASRRAYTDKTESRGYDHIGYLLNNGALEVVIGEAKYVSTVSSASSSLLEDINGKNTSELGHLTAKYFNDFINFVVCENKQFSEDEKLELKSLMQELNSLLVNGGKSFLEYVVDNNIRLNVVLFAVFSDNRENPDLFKIYYDRLYADAEAAIQLMGICNYSIEIVFIPTKATSMYIKGKIDDFYK